MRNLFQYHNSTISLSIGVLNFNEKKKKLCLIKKPDGGGIHRVET